MRSVQNMPRRAPSKRHGGCGAGFLVFILFLAVVIGVIWFIAKGSGSITDRIRKTQYPIKYEHFVEKYAKEYNLEPTLVFGVIRTESDFDVYAVSSADAKGLMQITDETASDCAKKIKMKNYTSDMLFDPETNIKLGCYYLNYLIGKYKHVSNALAAYNGGPGNADDWIESDENTDSSGKLVNIPFSETQNYVRRVLEAQQMYKELYNIN